MTEMTEERFLQLNPEAVALAQRKLHPKLHDDCVMKIYFYHYRGTQCAYAFCYQNQMVMNPIFMPIRIERSELALFCFEWFAHWEKVTDIKSVMDDEGWGFNCPMHMNSWTFAERWERRYTKRMRVTQGQQMGETLREHNKGIVLEKTKEYFKYATEEEIKVMKEELEGMLRVL